MAKKPKPIEIYDVAGQLNGPSPEEQALVDQEQRDLMELRRKEREPIEQEERRERDKRIQLALERQAEMRSILTLLKNMDERLTKLEAK